MNGGGEPTAVHLHDTPGDPDVLETVYLVDRPGQPDERALVRGRAAVAALATLGGRWRAVLVFRALPRPLLDLGYRVVARLRYRIFGRRACELPAPEARHKFVA